ncbi:FAD-dependent oxidoreductase [Sinosporangium siamense]|uniref:FAD-dependent oxidoreductase n=1 Tax=Sinosporangium siamense TaxID=1367973 RepID=UPI001EF260F6|nr:FAD-dependent oxidoreductase [Sinosporangium siamense]
MAGNLARRLSPADTEITVVNAEPDFVERLRLHQLAAGREIEAPKLADVFAGTGIGLSPPSTPERQVIAVTDTGGGGELGYDTLVYALGSRGDHCGVPGVAEHAFDIAYRPSALRLRERLVSLSRLGESGSVLVVGDGLTGIETATEIAECRPGLSVALVAAASLAPGSPLEPASGGGTGSCSRSARRRERSRSMWAAARPRTSRGASSRSRCGASRTRPSACPSAGTAWPPRRTRPLRRRSRSRPGPHECADILPLVNEGDSHGGRQTSATESVKLSLIL